MWVQVKLSEGNDTPAEFWSHRSTPIVNEVKESPVHSSAPRSSTGCLSHWLIRCDEDTPMINVALNTLCRLTQVQMKDIGEATSKTVAFLEAYLELHCTWFNSDEASLAVLESFDDCSLITQTGTYAINGKVVPIPSGQVTPIPSDTEGPDYDEFVANLNTSGLTN